MPIRVLTRVLTRVLIRSAAASLVPVLLCLWTPAAWGGTADRLASLQSADGWELAGDTSHDQLGAVSLSLKQVEGVRCLKGTATVAPAPAQLLAVVDDVAGALSWSTAGLSDSRELSRQAHQVEFLQVLAVPKWTMAADRYWVLRAQTQTGTDGRAVFSWDRFDWRTAYPAVAAELQAQHSTAVEPQPNFGAWVFVPVDGGTRLDYTVCTESGSLPQWLQRAAATRTVPAAMADVVVEAARRAQ